MYMFFMRVRLFRPDHCISINTIDNTKQTTTTTPKKKPKKQFEHNGYVNEYDELSIQSYVFANMIPTHGIS